MDFLSIEDASRYELLGEIGSGAFAKVFKAKDNKCDRFVAIKVLSCEPTHQMCERFHREVKTYLDAQHPNVVELFDANLAADSPYLIMEYVEASELGTQMREGKSDIQSAISVVMQIGSALCHMHHIGLLHRDIKPANILVKRDGHALLTDFNLVFDEEATALTATGHIVGTPRYISPEQWFGAPATAKSDVYSLGKVFYELLCLCGEDQSILQKPVNPDEPLPAIKSFLPDLPEELSHIVMKAVAHGAEDRYVSAKEFIKALDCYLTKGETKVVSSVKVHHRETTKRSRVFYITMAALALATFFLLFKPTKHSLRKRPLHCTFATTIDGVLVRSSLDEDSIFKALVVSTDGRNVWNSELRSEDKKLKFVIPWKGWYPKGKLSLSTGSYVMSTTCPSISRFIIGKARSTYIRDGLLITWVSSPGFTAFIEQKSGHKKLEAEYRKGQFECLIPTAKLLASPTEVRLSVRDCIGGTKFTPYFKAPKLDMPLFFSSIAQFKKEEPLSRYYNHLRYYLKLKEPSSKRLVLHKIRSDTKKLRAAISSVVDSRTALLSGHSLSDGEKLRLFNELMWLLQIERIVAALDGAKLFFQRSPFALGDFFTVKDWPTKTKVLRNKKGVLELLRSSDTQMIAAIDGPQFFRQKLASLSMVRDTVTRLVLPIMVSNSWLRGCGPRAGLLFQCAIDEDNYLELKINNRLSFIIWGEKKQKAGRLEFAKEFSFSSELLREGKNLIEMKHIAVLPRAGSIVLLKRIALLPNRLLQH